MYTNTKSLPIIDAEMNGEINKTNPSKHKHNLANDWKRIKGRLYYYAGKEQTLFTSCSRLLLPTSPSPSWTCFARNTESANNS